MKPSKVIRNVGINALDVSLGDFMTNIVSQSEKSTEPVEMALNVKINVLYKDKAWEVAASSNFVEKYKHEQKLERVCFDENQPDLYETSEG